MCIPEWLADIASGRAVLATKGVDYDYDKALAAARKRAAKGGGEVRY